MDKVSYSLGLGIGQQLAQMGANGISAEDFAQAIKDVLEGNELKISHRDAQGIVQEFFQKKEAEIQAQRAEQGKVHKEAGEKFLAENAKKEGVKTLPSGVQYKVIKTGEGAIPADTARVKLHYEGKTIDGEVFDSSYKRGQAIEMMVRQNIPGFAEAITHMPVGSTWEVYIPAEQAYGDRDMGQIKPYSTLIFKIELLEILK